ncbi:acyl-CoA thioesterase [Jeotgalibaca sp. MA1X17-3]|uniref:acyl-CoA thioesterase n=1 Tax=Jeotgalibaca sp. MA1X17-3 TaxID=2908211 RepID=UPI001F1DD887|nr:acyl-CoA thioesterase [Jeotgalibaca sp. MA1X17-3]UJF16493.1 acyl-CoA thioesterase [Jeotgalibaca sp. MA1X17-3]
MNQENKSKNVLTCNKTRVVRSEIALPKHLNDKETVFGGEIMSHFDLAGGNAVYNFMKKTAFTATMDHMAFIQPVHMADVMYIEAYVSGAGETSAEVFVKLVSNNVDTSEKKLCSYAFLTYVLADRTDPNYQMPEIKPESKEEMIICKGYKERRLINLAKRNESKELMKSIDLNPIWETR